MKALGGRLLRGAGRLALWAAVFAFFGITVVTQILPGIVSPVTLPEPTPEDKAAIEQAIKSPAGELLTKSGYSATIKVNDTEVIEFLDQQEKKANPKLVHPGPYVVFSLGKPPVAQAEDNGATDAVVDVANGALVAISQEFTNKRGSICYNSQTPEILQGAWPQINQYLRGKSMPMLVPIDHEKVDQLPASYATNCFVYPTS